MLIKEHEKIESKGACEWYLFIWGAYTSIVQENKKMERVDQTPKG